MASQGAGGAGRAGSTVKEAVSSNATRSASYPGAIAPLREAPAIAAGRWPSTSRRRRGRGPCGGPVSRPPAGQSGAKRNPAPSLTEVAGLPLLQRGQAGRMIGHHRVDQAVRKPSPQPVPVRGFPDRRAALVLGGPPQAPPPRRTSGNADRSRRRPVPPQTVPPRWRAARSPTPGAGCGRAHCAAGGLQQARDRRVLGRGGREARKSAYDRPAGSGAAAMTPGSSACTISSASSRASSARVASSRTGSRFPNSGTPESTRNAIEAEDPATVQPGQGGEVVRDRAAPEADIHPWSPAGGGPLEPQRVGRGGGRHAVERHVDQGGDAAGGSRPGRGREATPNRCGPVR